MNYIMLVNNFWDLDCIVHFSSLEAHLFFILLNWSNRNGWKQPLSEPNSFLKSKLKCSESALVRGRNKLIKHNLIKYDRGRRNVAGKYYIVDASKKYKAKSEFNTESSIYDYSQNRKQYKDVELSREIQKIDNKVGGSEKPSFNTYKPTPYKKKEKRGEDFEVEEGNQIHPNREFHLKIISLYNKTCRDLPVFDAVSVDLIEKLIEKRNKYLKNTEGWTKFFNKVHESDFLNNRIEDKQFLANLKWILEKDNFDKIMVGSFDKSFEQKNYRTDFYMSNKEKFKKAAEERRKREQLNE